MMDSDKYSDSKLQTDEKDVVSTSSVSLFLRFRSMLLILAHASVFALSLFIAFLFAMNMQLSTDWITRLFPPTLLFFFVIKLVVFGLFKQYRGWWRYAGISDLLSIATASLVSAVVILVFWFLLLNLPSVRHNFEVLTQVPQSIFPLDMFLTVLLLAGLRMSLRLYYEEFRSVQSGKLTKILIAGAGNAGEALLREIHRMQIIQYQVVGFVDDDAHKQGLSIHGIPVLGQVNDLPRICEEHGVEEVAIAMPSASHQQLRRVIQICSGTKVRFRTVPSITDIASGKFRVSQIRDIDINDLLGREAVELDFKEIEDFLHDKVILVTGAGGSIGSEMCRQICQFNPRLLLLVELAENPLFHIERELRQSFPNVSMHAVICNITDAERVDGVFDTFRPEIVVHAAAHKHVPLMEINPGESIKNNVVGTRTVADAADRYGATNFVMISTDKAVNPTSLMGSSKRVAEMYIQDLNNTSRTHFVTVRFGNVLGSNGSVVPLFKKQIADGGPITITHPDMKRYFMTIPEASQLVLQAATMGNGGEIFLLDMGEPVKIVDLAKELITLSGFVPGKDIDITFTGLRPGEKLFEELSIEGEDMQPTPHPKISIWKNIIKDRQILRANIDELVEIAKTQNHGRIIAKIKELIPEYIGKSN